MSSTRRLSGGPGLLAFLLLSFIPAMIGAATPPDDWYAGLVKPQFNPPSWVFGPVWTALYTLMAAAAWLVYRAAPVGFKTAHGLFAAQLAANAAWSPLFFGLHSPSLALACIIVLDVLVVLLLWRFWRWRRLAGVLLVPYLAWLGFATALNGAIVALN